MSLTNFAFLSTLFLLVLYPEHAEPRKLSSDDFFPSPTGCLNCSLCQYPCNPLPPPPPSLPQYPIYGAPPPPIPESPSYGTPPPQVNCTQFPAQCCFYPPPFRYQPVAENSSVSCSPFYFVSAMLLAICVSFLL
eukprot:XP_015577007.1 glyceraldehyde-3-phosphate dehydrogenase, testis-specific-like [Ricinus communis]